MKNLDLKSLLIGFLGAFVILLSINSTVVKTPENNIYEFSDKGEKDVFRFNKVTGNIESVNVRDGNVQQQYSISLRTPGYLDVKVH
tara:strand:+ start:148 stop:405 length:258 start_codon:yes stop_codon:yes gene_type:complete